MKGVLLNPYVPPAIKRPLALAVVLFIFLSCAPVAVASGGGRAVSAEGARGEASRLIAKVSGYTASHPSGPGGVPSWKGAAPGGPLMVRSMDGGPLEYVVPVNDRDGRVVSTIGVCARTGRWRWYSASYRFEKFPPVDATEAAGEASGYLRAKGIQSKLPSPEARLAPDKMIYWFFKMPRGRDITGMYVPVFLSDRAYSNLEAPWKLKRDFEKERSAEGGPPANQGKGARGPITGGAPPAYNIANVPYHRQENSYWCGPASLEMIFDYFGPDVSQAQIAGVADAQEASGCYNTELLRAGQFSSRSASFQNPSLFGYTGRSLGYGSARRYWSEGGSLYASRFQDLKNLVSQNYPVLLLTYYDTPPSSGHFRVVKGYNDTLGTFIVHDPWYSAPYAGPDVSFEQGFLVDTLWTYSNRWGMIAAPWGVSVSKPSNVTAGQTFTVSATVSYRGPQPFGGQYSCTEPTASIQIPASGYQLVGGDPAKKTLTGVTTTGTSGTAGWTLQATAAKNDTNDINVTAQGLVSGSTNSYPSYSDWIGGAGAGGPAPRPAATPLYFAEGCTRLGYETWICIQNPKGQNAEVTITYMLGDGDNLEQKVTVPAHSRYTVSVNDFIASKTEPYQDVSAKVVCTNGVNIIAERPMYFNADGINGGHGVVGANAAGKEWYFAEGNTYGWNKEWLCLQNPGDTNATVQVFYMFLDGTVNTKVYPVGARSRSTVNVNTALSPRRSDVSMMVASSVPIVAERPMYFRYNQRWAGGSNVMGAPAPSTKWYFAEGNTRPWNDMWICLQNPNDTPAKVSVTYKSTSGPGLTATYDVAAKSRYTINVNKVVGQNVDLGADIQSDVPIVAERPMYFNYHEKWAGGDAVVGCNKARTSWYFAEGCTRNEANRKFDTWICIQNPTTPDTTVTITYMLSTGRTITRNYPVKASSRLTVDVNADVGPGQDVAIQVTCPVGVIVERPMYFNQHGDMGGSTVMGY